MKLKATLSINTIGKIPFDPFLSGDCNELSFTLDVANSIERMTWLMKMATWIRIVDLEVYPVIADGIITELDAKRMTNQRREILNAATSTIEQELRKLDPTKPIAYKYACHKDFNVLVQFEVNELVVLP
jgi:hypothetical protein